MHRKTIGLAMCGSFCTFARVLDAFSALDREQYDLVPIQSQAAYSTDTRFGAAADFRARLEALCGRPIIHTIDGLAGNAASLGALLNRRGYYFVPFGQDSAIKKPRSLVADFPQLPAALAAALQGHQLQPMLCGART